MLFAVQIAGYNYTNIAVVLANFCVSHPNHAVSRVKIYIAKSALNEHLGSSTDPYYIQSPVITNSVIKRLRCT